MPLSDQSALVETDWLHDHLSAPDLRLVDATWYLPVPGKPESTPDAHAEFERCHLPGAVFLDIDDISDDRPDLPHMLPSPIKFSARARQLGLGDGSHIVLYDNNNYFASARAWWMFRTMGHEDVAILNGGLKKWRAENRQTEDFADKPQARHLTSRQNNLLIRELSQMRANLTSKKEQIIDARSPERFKGLAPEPRPGLRTGHIPGSMNLPFSALINEDGTFKDKAALKSQLEEAGLDLARPVTTTCGSGVSAALINVALFELGIRNAAMYDGSWTEWGSQTDTPIEK